MPPHASRLARAPLLLRQHAAPPSARPAQSGPRALARRLLKRRPACSLAPLFNDNKMNAVAGLMSVPVSAPGLCRGGSGVYSASCPASIRLRARVAHHASDPAFPSSFPQALRRPSGWCLLPIGSEPVPGASSCCSPRARVEQAAESDLPTPPAALRVSSLVPGCLAFVSRPACAIVASQPHGCLLGLRAFPSRGEWRVATAPR